MVHPSGPLCFLGIMISNLWNHFKSSPDFGYLLQGKEISDSSQFYQTMHNQFGLVSFSFMNEVRLAIECPYSFNLSALKSLHFLEVNQINHLGRLKADLNFLHLILLFRIQF